MTGSGTPTLSIATALLTDAAGLQPSMENLLLWVPPGHRVRAVLRVNERQSEQFIAGLEARARLAKSRLLLTGGYTSPGGWPVGLTVAEGTTYNPALREWDGLLLIGPDGRPRIVSFDALSLLRPLAVRHVGHDYAALLAYLEGHAWSAVQSHLLVYGGCVLVSPGAATAAPRRIVFETNEGGFGVYDSGASALTLREAAEVLVQHYGAVRALNLDTGTYSYARRYQDGRLVRDASTLGRGVLLSNVLLFDEG